MKTERIKGWLGLAGTLLILYYIGSLYPIAGFDALFGVSLFSGILAVPAVLLASYRRVGTLPAWGTIAAAYPVLFLATGNVATSVLAWALLCGIPLAVTLCWPYYKTVGPLTAHALPLAGVICLGGASLYCKLHFGGWGLYRMTTRIALRYGVMLDEMEGLFREIYGEKLSAELLEVMRSMITTMGFFTIMMIAYGLMASYFLGIWIADRSVREERWLGSWSVLIPGRGISWLYILAYLLVQFTGGAQMETFMAVIYLFGFFFVFTAVYWIRCLMRKKNWSGIAQFLVVGILLILSYCSVGGALLSPYTILLYLGWWISTQPGKRKN